MIEERKEKKNSAKSVREREELRGIERQIYRKRERKRQINRKWEKERHKKKADRQKKLDNLKDEQLDI